MKTNPRALHVALNYAPKDAVRVGRIILDGGVAVFGYDETFIAAGQRINPAWPAPDRAAIRARNPRVFNGLHGVFADSLPDAWGLELMRRRSSAHGVDYDGLTALDRLALVGSSGPGALTYEPDRSEHARDSLDLDALARGTTAILDGTPTELVEELARLGGSSGGARPKVLVARNASGHTIDGSGAIPEGYTPYIVKFRAPSDITDIGPLEAAYADMAREAAVEVSPTALLEASSGPGYFAAQRFDRAGGARRIHMLSVAAILEVDWREPAIDYTQLIALVNGITRDHAAAEQMFRRMVFNVLACNRDDHTKQHSFLQRRDGSWTLAPAYDLTLSSGPNGQHYLAVNGKGAGVTADDILAVAREAGIKGARAKTIVADVRGAIAQFPMFAERYGVSKATQTSFRRLQAA